AHGVVRAVAAASRGSVGALRHDRPAVGASRHGDTAPGCAMVARPAIRTRCRTAAGWPPRAVGPKSLSRSPRPHRAGRAPLVDLSRSHPVIDSAKLLTDLKAQLKLLVRDLTERAEDAESTWGRELRDTYRQAFEKERTGLSWVDWRDNEVDQAAVAWLVASTFL